jgi:hypothetical protein
VTSENEDDDVFNLEEKLQDTTFEDIAREQREKKATKADETQVPEYLWQEHLIDDADPLINSDTSTWTKHQLATLPTLMNGLRKIGLKWWKKNVTLSFGKWLKGQFAAARKPSDGPILLPGRTVIMFGPATWVNKPTLVGIHGENALLQRA